MLQAGILWLIAIVAFTVFEAITYQIVSIWFAFGATGALIAYVCGANTNIQIFIFVILSVVLLALLRPVSMKLLGDRKLKTNADGLDGKTVLITQEVCNLKETGQGKVNGMVWTVRSASDNTVIPTGETAKILKIEGVKLIVEK